MADSKFGALPIFSSTFVITIIAMSVALPIGLGSAIFLSEYASPFMRDHLNPLLEILAGIPTVVYGFFAAAIVHFFGLFGIHASFNSALASGVVMGIIKLS